MHAGDVGRAWLTTQPLSKSTHKQKGRWQVQTWPGVWGAVDGLGGRREERKKEEKKWGGRRNLESWKIKRDKQKALVGGGRRVVPQRDHSWCLTPLVLLMCDAQEIDRLCKTQPTGENSNNKRQTHEKKKLSWAMLGRNCWQGVGRTTAWLIHPHAEVQTFRVCL